MERGLVCLHLFGPCHSDPRVGTCGETIQCCAHVETRSITGLAFWNTVAGCMQLQCQCYNPLINPQGLLRISHTHHTPCNITITYIRTIYFRTGVTLVAMQVFPSPCELQLLKPRQPQLASWICSVCAVAFAFQANDGSDEKSQKSPFETKVRIKASWASCSFSRFCVGKCPRLSGIHSGTNTVQPQHALSIRWTNNPVNCFFPDCWTVRNGQISPQGISMSCVSICSGGSVFKFFCQCAGRCICSSLLCTFWLAFIFTKGMPYNRPHCSATVYRAWPSSCARMMSQESAWMVKEWMTSRWRLPAGQTAAIGVEGAAVRKGRPSLAGELGVWQCHFSPEMRSQFTATWLSTWPLPRANSAQALADAIRVSKTVTSVLLDNNNFGNDGLKASSAGPWNGRTQGETESDVELWEFRVLGHFPAADCSEAEVVCEAWCTLSIFESYTFHTISHGPETLHLHLVDHVGYWKKIPLTTWCAARRRPYGFKPYILWAVRTIEFQGWNITFLKAPKTTRVEQPILVFRPQGSNSFKAWMKTPGDVTPWRRINHVCSRNIWCVASTFCVISSRNIKSYGVALTMCKFKKHLMA